MKYLISVVAVISLFFFTSSVSAEQYINSEHIVTVQQYGPGEATVDITFVNNSPTTTSRKVTVNETKTGSTYSGEKFSETYTISRHNQKISFLLTGLTPKKYYLFVQGKDKSMHYPFEISYMPVGYKLSLVQQNGVLNVAYYVPTTDTRAFYLNFKNNQNQTVLLQSAPSNTTKTSSNTTTTYFYTLGDITMSLAGGTTYGVTLEAPGTTGSSQTLYGPVFVSFTKTNLVGGTLGKNVDYQWPLDYSKATETPVVLKGKINTTENADFKTFEITVALNINSDFSGESKLGTVAISDDGTYTATFSDLTPSTTYYVRHSIKTPQSTIDEKIDKFNSTRGHFTAGSSGAQADFDSRSYKLLSPLPNLAVLFDPDLCVEQLAAGKPVFGGSCDNQVNAFINYLFQLLIGLAAVILVIKIMYNGYQYIMTDVPFLKASMKNSLWQSVFGLLVVLSSFLILNTINPKLVENVVSLQPVLVGVEIVTLPDAGDTSVDPDFKQGKGTYNTDATISPAVIGAVEKIKNGWIIDSFHVYTNDRMLIKLKKGAQTDVSTIIDVSHGLNGFAPSGTAKTGDKKTPLGVWKIIDIRKPVTEKQAVFNGNGANMGAAFFHLNPMQNGERGIGIHGNKNGTLGATSGCIRMKNADIIALFPYITEGTPVIVQ